MAAGAGATRRNRPNLQTGDLVYCRVLTASRDLEPTLSCVDASGKVMILAVDTRLMLEAHQRCLNEAN